MKRYALLTLFVLLLLTTLACKRSLEGETPPLTPSVLIGAATQTAGQSLGQTVVVPLRPAGTAVTAQPGDTPAPGTTPLPTQPPRRYAVFFLGEGDILNVRTGPGVGYDILTSLSYVDRDLEPAGGREEADGMFWQEITLPDGSTGWVSTSFLVEQVQSQAFCEDARIGELLDRLAAAIKGRDGEALARLVNPAHGLTIQYDWWNPTVTFTPDLARSLFISTNDYEWGIGGGSGLPIVGPFSEQVLPGLDDVFSQGHSRHCNLLDQGVAVGASSAELRWPADYANLNYVALYRLAPPDEEMNWRTWAVGIDYVAGQPYLAVLVQYSWSP